MLCKRFYTKWYAWKENIKPFSWIFDSCETKENCIVVKTSNFYAIYDEGICKNCKLLF